MCDLAVGAGEDGVEGRGEPVEGPPGELDASLQSLQWVTNSYLLALAAPLIRSSGRPTDGPVIIH